MWGFNEINRKGINKEEREMNFELIDRIQDILSIPIALYICYQLHMIRRVRLKDDE